VLYNRYSTGAKKCANPAPNGFAISGHSVKVVSAVLDEDETSLGRTLEDLKNAAWGSSPNLKERTFALLLGHLNQKLRVMCKEFIRIFSDVPVLGLLSDTLYHFDSLQKFNRERNPSGAPSEELKCYVQRKMYDWGIQQTKAVVVFVVFC